MALTDRVIPDNRDAYPLTNIRWKHGLFYFVAFPVAVLVYDGEIEMAVPAVGVGFAFLLLVSISMYCLDNYGESTVAKTGAAVLGAGIVTGGAVAVYLAVTVLVDMLTPVGAVIAVFVLSFGACFLLTLR